MLGDVTVNPDGSLTYDSPILGIAVTRTFTYTVSDGAGGTDTATVTIDIQPTAVATSTHHLGTSGSSATTYALRDTPPPAGELEPDHDGDGDPGLSGHYQVYLQDCAADGTGCVLLLASDSTGCVLLLASDSHVGHWNAGTVDWVLKELLFGTIDHTFAAGRMLRVRLMFDHNPMWVAMSQDHPTEIMFDVP